MKQPTCKWETFCLNLTGVSDVAFRFETTLDFHFTPKARHIKYTTFRDLGNFVDTLRCQFPLSS